MVSQVIEDYLKIIYKVQAEEGKATTSAVAERMGVAAASATNMIKKLAETNLVCHTPYHGVKLTPAGERIALEVIRHHRLVELYLAEALGLPWDQVHAEAEKWEHILSEDLENRMDAILGYPTADPHGAPIPTKDGVMVQTACRCLAEMEPGQSGVVAEVDDEEPEMLRYLGDLGLYPNVAIDVIDKAPFKGPLRVKVGEVEHILGRELAGRIRIASETRRS